MKAALGIRHLAFGKRRVFVNEKSVKMRLLVEWQLPIAMSPYSIAR